MCSSSFFSVYILSKSDKDNVFFKIHKSFFVKMSPILKEVFEDCLS